MKSSEACVLCHSSTLEWYFTDKRRQYHQCQVCELVQVKAEYHLSEEAEKAEYDKHDNHIADLGYQRFLSRCLDPVLDRVTKQCSGLDFGCGEGQVLSQMAKAKGYQMANYDLYYANDPQRLTVQYDFITMTEVLEHIHQSHLVLTQLKSLLKSKGLLAVMTKRVKNRQAFSQWHYKNDPTHICFYSETAFRWLAEHFDWHLEIISDDVVIFVNKE